MNFKSYDALLFLGSFFFLKGFQLGLLVGFLVLSKIFHLILRGLVPLNLALEMFVLSVFILCCKISTEYLLLDGVEQSHTLAKECIFVRCD